MRYRELTNIWAERDERYAVRRLSGGRLHPLSPDEIVSIRLSRVADIERWLDYDDQARALADVASWRPPRQADI